MTINITDITDWKSLPVGETVASLVEVDPHHVSFTSDLIYQVVNPLTGLTDIAFIVTRPSRLTLTATVEAPDRVGPTTTFAAAQMFHVATCRTTSAAAIESAISILQHHLKHLPEMTQKALSDSGLFGANAAPAV